MHGVTINSKTSNVDISILTSDQTRITLEMQKNKPEYDMKERLLYYVIQLYYENYLKGNNYDSRENIVICLTDYNILQGNKYMETYKMRGEKDEIKGIKIVILDFKKIKYCDNIVLRGWVDMITRNDFTEFVGANEEINKAAEKVVELNEDAQALLVTIRNMEKYDRIQALKREEKIKKEAIELGIEKGIEKGVEKGTWNAKKEIVKNMYTLGIEIDKISSVCNLSIEEIKEIIE